MRIALVVPGFSAHEEEWAIPVLQNMAVSLAKVHEVHVFCLRYPPRPEKRSTLSFQNLTVHPIGGGQRYQWASISIWNQTLQVIKKQHRRQPFDLFHAFWADESGLVAGVAGKFLHRPVVVSSAGGEFVFLPDIDYGTSGSRFRRAVVSLALRLADVVTAGSHYQEELCLVKHVPAGKVQHLPLGVDIERFYPAPLPVEPLTLVQAGSLTPVKNQSFLLSVFQMVREQIPDAQLLLVGKGPLRPALFQQAEQLNIDSAIEWMGEVPYPHMPALYAQAHLYVQTSRHESQGMAVLEAMSCGLPVVSTPVGVARDVALLPDRYEPASFANTIVQLWQAPGVLQKKSQQAIEMVREHYALNRVVTRFNVLYDQLLS